MLIAVSIVEGIKVNSSLHRKKLFSSISIHGKLLAEKLPQKLWPVAKISTRPTLPPKKLPVPSSYELL
jgi:hypothetical protein